MSLYESIIVVFTAMGFTLALIKLIIDIIDIFLNKENNRPKRK